jgi:hypothetical protein
MSTAESSEPALTDLSTAAHVRKVSVSAGKSVSQPEPRRPTVREKSAPKNLLDLIDRLLVRATSSWQAVLMHLVLVVAVSIGLVRHGRSRARPRLGRSSGRPGVPGGWPTPPGHAGAG